MAAHSADTSAAGPDGPMAGGVVAGHGVTSAAAGAIVSHLEINDLDREGQSQPEKQQASVAAENLSSSQSVGTEVQSQSTKNVEEAASTSLAGRNHTVVTNEGRGVFSSQASCEGDDVEYDPESDTVSIGETSNRNTDLFRGNKPIYG